MVSGSLMLLSGYIMLTNGSPRSTSTNIDYLVKGSTATPGATRTFHPLKMATQTPVTPVGIPLTWTPYGAVCSCNKNLYNCGDFEDAARAQACFKFCNEKGAGDVHRLDQDGDGLVCEMEK
jgi:hypothetical protein